MLAATVHDAVSARPDGEAAVAAFVTRLTAGKDAALGVRWRLVDGEGRRIGREPGGSDPGSRPEPVASR